MGRKKRVFCVGALYDGAGRFLQDCEVFVENGVIGKILLQNDRGEEANSLRRRFADVDSHEFPHAIMLPGLVNCHHHAYSALARGMPVTGIAKDFPSTLETLWWRLDRALDADAVRLSGLVTAIESIRHGCTTIFDHHSSPGFVEGSLETLAQAFGELSMRALLCFETSDRNGEAVFQRSVEENLAFARGHVRDEAVKGLFGLHASFTLSARSLSRLAEAIPEDLPVHVHAAEDVVDVEHARKEGFEGPVDRLHKTGVLRQRSLLAHGVHLSPAELATIEATDAYLVHNPQSNCNNRVGYGDPSLWDSSRVLLGTDGMSSNMLGQAQFGYLAQRALGEEGGSPFELVEKMLFDNPTAYSREIFGPQVGGIREGQPADFAIFDYHSPTPVSADNLTAHLLFGLAQAPSASWVYARGVPVLENGSFRTIDEMSVLEAAAQVASHVWERYEAL